MNRKILAKSVSASFFGFFIKLVVENETSYYQWIDGVHELHRLDGPAVEFVDGHKEWYQNGKLHRLDGPAIECANGDKCWYQNGQRHRLDGPAVELADGYKAWYQNGQLVKS